MPERRRPNSHRPAFREMLLGRTTITDRILSIIERAKEGSTLAVVRELETMDTDEIKYLRGFLAAELNRVKNLQRTSPQSVDSKHIARLEALLRIIDRMLHDISHGLRW